MKNFIVLFLVIGLIYLFVESNDAWLQGLAPGQSVETIKGIVLIITGVMVGVTSGLMRKSDGSL